MKLRLRKKWDWKSWRKRFCVEMYIDGLPFLAGWTRQRWVGDNENPEEVRDDLFVAWQLGFMPRESHEDILIKHEEKWNKPGIGSMMREGRKFHEAIAQMCGPGERRQ